MREALPPHPRHEREDVPRRIPAEALEHIDEAGVRIDTVQPAGGQQALQSADVPGTSSVQQKCQFLRRIEITRSASSRSCAYTSPG